MILPSNSEFVPCRTVSLNGRPQSVQLPFIVGTPRRVGPHRGAGETQTQICWRDALGRRFWATADSAGNEATPRGELSCSP
jgi:hypothetical protein